MPGLPCTLGTVQSRDAGALVLQGLQGERRFILDADSDIPAQVRVSDYVTVKYYHDEHERPHLLNAVTEDASPVVLGRLVALDRERATLRTLDGDVALRVPRVHLQVGRLYRASCRPTHGNPPALPAGAECQHPDSTPLDVERIEEVRALEMRARVVSCDPGAGHVELLRTGTANGMQFDFDTSSLGGRALRKGDRLLIAFALPKAGLPRVERFIEIRTVPVLFGEIVRMEDDRLVLRSPWEGEKSLGIDAQTYTPFRVKPGMCVDVKYETRPDGALVARAVLSR